MFVLLLCFCYHKDSCPSSSILPWISWNYSDVRLKKTLRASRATFHFILSRVGHVLQRQTVTEEAILPEERLGICLYRLGRGDYYNTIAEMVGRGVATVSFIVQPGFSSSSSKIEHLMQKVLVQLKQIYFVGASKNHT